MKTKKLLLMALSTSLLFSSVLPTYATDLSQTIIQSQEDNYVVQPRYKYVESARIGISPSDSGSDYLLAITGIAGTTSTSGTLTVYRKNLLGIYYKVDSVNISESGSSFRKTGTLKSDGSGTYKVEFVGKVYAGSASESITISSTNSY